MTEHEISYEVETRDFNGIERKTAYVHCSCGFVDKSYGDRGYAVKDDGKTPYKRARWAAWQHLAIVTDRSNAKGAPMELVGRIVKTRVTNEVWVVSTLGEVPSDWVKNAGWAPNPGTRTATPWCAILKHSRGWKTLSAYHASRETAYASALGHLESAYVDGHEVEMASELNIDTVEIPFGTIDTYFKQLSERAKTAEKTEDLVDLHRKIEQALAVADMLKSAREEVQAKLLFDE